MNVIYVKNDSKNIKKSLCTICTICTLRSKNAESAESAKSAKQKFNTNYGTL